MGRRKVVVVDEVGEVPASVWDAVMPRPLDMRAQDEIGRRRADEMQRRHNETQSRRLDRPWRGPIPLTVPVGLGGWPVSLPPGVTRVTQDYSGRLRVRVRAGSSPA